jgi:hypothetical protein
MAAEIVEVLTAPSLFDVNVGLAGALGVINPLAAQLDAALSLGILPFQAELSAQLDASVALSLTMPSVSLAAALSAMADIQASIQAALAAAITMPGVGISADLSASIAAKLGLLSVLIDGMLAVKIPALGLAGELAAALAAGPVVLLAFDGVVSSPATMQEIGAAIATKFGGPVGESPNTIQSSDNIVGMMIIAKGSAVFTAFGGIFGIPSPLVP